MEKGGGEGRRREEEEQEEEEEECEKANRPTSQKEHWHVILFLSLTHAACLAGNSLKRGLRGQAWKTLASFPRTPSCRGGLQREKGGTHRALVVRNPCDHGSGHHRQQMFGQRGW